MTATTTPPAHLARVYELLVATYGEPKNEPDYDPLGGLIGTILSQHTSDSNSGKAYTQLVTAFPGWEEIRDAPTHLVAEAIRVGGLANVKAVRIQRALHILTDRQRADGKTGPLDKYLLEELIRRTPEEAWSYLRSIPGVGPKTAACVLMFDLQMPVMPVDTHVHRVACRLGLIGPKVSAEQAHTIFAKITPPQWIYTLHVDLIRHGRQVCHAQRPDCDHCPLYPECAYAGSVNAQEMAISR